MSAKPRWDLPTRKEWEESGFVVPDELCAKPAIPFNDTVAIEAQGHSGATPVEDCRHSWFRAGRCAGNRYRCIHCHTIAIFEESHD